VNDQDTSGASKPTRRQSYDAIDRMNEMKQPVESMDGYHSTGTTRTKEEEWLVGTARVANEEEEDDQGCRNEY